MKLAIPVTSMFVCLFLFAQPLQADWTAYPMQRDQRGVREVQDHYADIPEEQLVDVIAGDIRSINWLNDGYRILFLLDMLKGQGLDDGELWRWVLAIYDHYEWQGNKLFLFILVGYWTLFIGD